MHIPVYLVVVQWVTLAFLAAFVVIAFRQLGRVFGLKSPQNELGPGLGEPAPALDYIRSMDSRPYHFIPGTTEKEAVVAFADPVCPACEQLVDALNDLAAAGALDGRDLILLTSYPPDMTRVSPPFTRTPFELGQTSQTTLDAYRVLATPLLVLIDATGRVAASGLAASRADVLRHMNDATNMESPGLAVHVSVPAAN